MSEVIDPTADLDRAEASYELEIVAPGDLSCSINIELDDKLNGGKSCFGPGDEFWIRVWSPVAYDIYMTGGGIIERQNNVVEDIPDLNDPETENEWEYINFTDWKGNASKPIYSITAMFWCFHSLGQVQWNQNYSELTVQPPENTTDMGYGVLRIQFKTKFNRIKLRAPQEGHDIKVIIFSTDLNQPDCKSELQVQIRDDCSAAAPKDITIEVVNCLSDNAIQGVSVYVNNLFKGITDVSGQLYIGLLKPGRYETRFEHPEYWPSGSDGVVNDSFVVE